MANKIKRESTKNVIETMKEINKQPNMELGIDSIEFPDGTVEKFYYNGEADRQAAIRFATICVNATTTTPDAKRMMQTCFNLKVNGINPERVIVVRDFELYLDVEKAALFNSNGDVYVALTDEEKKLKMSTDVLVAFLKERAERKQYMEKCEEYSYDDPFEDCELELDDDYEDEYDDCDDDMCPDECDCDCKDCPKQ